MNGSGASRSSPESWSACVRTTGPRERDASSTVSSDFLTADEGAGTHAEAARELCMTEAAVKVAVHRLRRRYRDELRRRVADTVESAEDVEDEIRYLLKTLGRSKDDL